jgi:poly-gamma-glutamate synthesis protein (capsule biosynthesis protein)
MIPMQRRKFRLNRAVREDGDWLGEVLDRESRQLGARVERAENAALLLRW